MHCFSKFCARWLGLVNNRLASRKDEIMKKTKIDLFVVMAALLLWAANAGAGPHHIPDGGATASLFAVGVAGLAAVRKFIR